MAGWLDDFDFRKDAHKIFISVGVVVLGRFIYDRIFNQDDGLDIPLSDEIAYSKRIKIAAGPRGIIDTLRIMAHLVRRDRASLFVRRAALEIVAGCQGHGFDCELERLFYYCRSRIVYRRDPAGVEWVQDAKRTIEIGHGDCDDKSVALASLAGSLGFKSRFVVCGFAPNRFTHVYVEILTAKGWLPFDPTPENMKPGIHAQAPYRSIFRIFKQ